MSDKSNGIVISSRVRLARNFAGMRFPARLGDAESAKVLEMTENALKSGGEKFGTIKIADMTDLQAETLKELHMISDDLLHGNKNAAVITNRSNDVCIMVNEEDHLREQCIMKGNRLSQAYSRISAIDDTIASACDIAYDKRLGYLTACPTNVGTGLRASALMFLPGLGMTDSLSKCVSAAARFDMAVRGEYGEGSRSGGYLYQISNSKTLGVSEDEIISGVASVVEQIEQSEVLARKALLESNEVMLRDGIMRAYGILTNAYRLPFDEFEEKYALVKLGVYYGFISCTDTAAFEAMLDKYRPANMMTQAKKIMNDGERDLYRAANAAAELKSLTAKV